MSSPSDSRLPADHEGLGYNPDTPYSGEPLPDPAATDPCNPDAEFPPESVQLTPDEELGAYLEECYAAVPAITSALRANLARVTASAYSGRTAVQAAIAGWVQPQLDDCSSICVRIVADISGWVRDTLTAAAEVAYTLQTVAPTTVVAPTTIIPGEPLPITGVSPSPVEPPVAAPGQPAPAVPIIEPPPEPSPAEEEAAWAEVIAPPADPNPVPPLARAPVQLPAGDVMVDQALDRVPGVDPAHALAYCQDVARVRTTLISWGRTLLARREDGAYSFRLSPAFAMNLLAWIVKGVASYQGFSDRFQEWVAKSGYAGAYNTYYDAVAIYAGDATENVAALVAVRIAVGALDDMVHDSSWTQVAGYNAENTAGGHIPFVPIGGATVGTHRSDDGKVGLGTSIHLFCVPLIELVDRLIRSEAPVTPPSTADAVEQYLRGAISLDTCRCIVRLNGDVWDVVEGTITARRERPDTNQVLSLLLRGEIRIDEAHRRLRNLGWLDPDERDNLLSLTSQIPGPGDIVHFMVRNVYDQGIVDAFHLDDEFGDKYRGQLKEWGDSQGIGAELARAYWRAHWVVPSPGQLFEMVQRLRPGRVEGELVTTIADVNRALGENDVLPFWRRRLLSIAYRPLGRIDLRRGYLGGSLTRTEYIEGIKDIGYSDLQAEQLAEQADFALDDLLDKHPWVKRYEAHAASAEEAIAALTRLGYRHAAIVSALQRADEIVRAASRQICIRGVHDRIKHGDTSYDQASRELAGQGLDAQQVDFLIASWKCERQHTPKEIPGAQLTRWAEEGLISITDLVRRLITLGYGQEDARLIADDMNLRHLEKENRAHEALARRQSAETKAQQAAREKEVAKVAKAAKQTAAGLARASKDVAKRAKDLLTAAARYAKYQGGDVDQAGTEIHAQIDRLLTDRRMTATQAELVVIAAVKQIQKGGTADFAALVDQTKGAALVVTEPEVPSASP